ncbi:MAG: hypothetical protein K9H16_14730 [Bacteroidales bacterium]|nr:hypothetical protein [Bacteroidales bacterium]
MKGTFLSVFISIILLFFATSCSIERKLAKEFVKQHDSISVLLIPPAYVFKTNLNAFLIEGYDKLSDEEQQKQLYDSSRFLQALEDTLIISRFFSELETALRKYGIYTYTHDEVVEFMSKKNPAYQVTLAQMELEEDIYPYRAQEVFFDTVLFYEDFDLYKMGLNTWFEISKLNDPKAVNNILYASDFVTDELEGRFTSNIFTGEVKFKYNIFPLETEDVYTLAASAGERYAGYIFDYIMNQYIFFNFPDGNIPDIFLSYDHESGMLFPAGDRRFLFLDE